MYKATMSPEELAEAAYNEHGWEMAGYYWGGIASRARDMFRMYRYKDHFEYRKENPEIEVAPGVKRKEIVPSRAHGTTVRCMFLIPTRMPS